MFDPKRMIDQLMSSGVAGGLAGGVAGGALANALSGKKGKKLAGSALKLGGLALVGGVAYKAWQSYRHQAGTATDTGITAPPEGSAFLPARNDSTETNALSLLIARSMIAAAKADGQIDTEESQAILNQINSLDMVAEDKAFLFEEYGRPLDIKALTAAVDTPEHAAELYAASVLMIDLPSPAERIYLDTLARELGLEAALVDQIHATAQANRVAA